MLPSADEIIARRRRLSADYEAKQETVKRKDASRPVPKLLSLGTSNMVSVPHYNYPGRTAAMLESTNGDEGTSKSVVAQEDLSPGINMKLPSVRDIISRRGRPSSSYKTDEAREEAPTPELRAIKVVGCRPTVTSSGPRRRSLDSRFVPDGVDLAQLLPKGRDKDMEMSAIDQAGAGKGSLTIHRETQIRAEVQKDREPPTPELVRALEGAGCCSTYTGSGPRRRSLDSLSLPDEIDLDQLLSNISYEETELLSGNQLEDSKGSVPMYMESQTSAQVRKEQVPTDPPQQEAEHGGREENVVSPRDCTKGGWQKPRWYIGPGLGSHIIVVPPPRRRLSLSELYVNEVVLVKRDRNVWVFAQVKMLTCRGIRAWVPTVQLMVNIPVEIMYTHLRKVEDDEELKDLPGFAAHATLRDEDGGQQQRIPLPATFDRGKSWRTESSPKSPKKHKHVHLVRPAHLAHRTLHQCLQSTLSCTICLQLMSPMDAHKPWDCEHFCHLFCYQLLVQGAGSNSCNTCSMKKSWEWKTITCQCGFKGFVQKRVDDLEPPRVCPSCCKYSPTLNRYQPSAADNSGSEPALQSSVPTTTNNVGMLMESPFQGSQLDFGECTPLPKLSKRVVDLNELEWRYVNCECGFRGTIRVSADSIKLPNCPACLNPVQDWLIPCKDDLLKALLGYTPPDSPTYTYSGDSSSPSRTGSPLSLSSADDATPSDFSVFDGVKSPSISPSLSLAPVITPSSMQIVSSSAPSDQSEISTYMSCQSSPQSNSPPPPSPRKEPLCISPKSSSMPSPAASSCTTNPVSIESPVGSSPRKPPRSPVPSSKPAPPSYSTKPRQVPTDSLTFRVTPAQLKQQMREQARKQTAEILESKHTEREQIASTSAVTRGRDIVADSGSRWLTPATVRESAMEDELQQEPVSVAKKFSSRDTVNNSLSTSTPKHGPPAMAKKSTDSVSMWMTPELIKQMAMEEGLRQQGQEQASSSRQMASAQGPLQPKQTPSTTARKFSSTDSIPMWMILDLMKKMASEKDLPRQEHNPTSSESPSKLSQLKVAPSPIQTRDLPTDSVSMWMTPAKIKRVAMEEELRKQQNHQPVPQPKPTAVSNLTTDSISLGMTPSNIEQMAMMEEETRRQRQGSSVILGEDLHKPISTVVEEEESDEYSNEEEELRIQRLDLSSKVRQSLPTDSASYWMTPAKVKKMQELQAQQIAHFEHRLVPSGSEALDCIQETEDDVVSDCHPQLAQPKSIETLKKLPLTLQHIPEDDEVTHRLTPDSETKSSDSSSSSSSSSASPSHQPTSLSTRLEKLREKKPKISSPPMHPDISQTHQPDRSMDVQGSHWMTIVRDGHANVSVDQKELEIKAKEVESKHGMQ